MNVRKLKEILELLDDSTEVQMRNHHLECVQISQAKIGLVNDKKNPRIVLRLSERVL